MAERSPLTESRLDATAAAAPSSKIRDGAGFASIASLHGTSSVIGRDATSGLEVGHQGQEKAETGLSWDRRTGPGGSQGRAGGEAESAGPTFSQCWASLDWLGPFVFLLLDVGWISRLPSIGLPALVLGFVVQLVAIAKARHHETFRLFHQLALFMWLLGNSSWMCGEYVWDEDEPAGFLGKIAFTVRLSQQRSLYPVFIGIGVTLMCVAVLGLAVCYCAAGASKLFRLRSHTYLLRRPWAAADVLQEEACLGQADPGDANGVHACGIPLPLYCELFILPWLLSDICWELSNLTDLDEVQLGELGTAAPVIISLAAAAAIILSVDAARRQAIAYGLARGLLGLSDVFWVAGNITWALEDVLSDNGVEAARLCALALFGLGLALIATSLCAAACRVPCHPST